MSEADILQRMIRENQEGRARFERLSARTSDAILSGNLDELGNIVRDATVIADSQSGAGSPEPVEAGNADGVTGDSVSAGSSADEPEEPGS